MTATLEALLTEGKKYISTCAEKNFNDKSTAEKWSKKEILGHLIDSAINNFQRFTEIQFAAKPFLIRKYNQNELVKANDYQHAATAQLLELWLALNYRIIQVMNLQTEKTLAYEIKLDDDHTADLRFLMTDYIDHLAHHLKQIMK